MHNFKSDDSIQALVDEVNIDDLVHQSDEGPRVCPIAMWVPAEYKEKYALIQNRTKQRFGKITKEVVMKLIDRVYAEVKQS